MRLLVGNLQLARKRWQNEPLLTLLKVILSFGGQIFGWTVGQDYIGIGMRSIWRPGIGHKLARYICRHLTITPRLAWTIKAIEIASDATKCPIEGRLYRRYGIVPDTVAALVTQPAWSIVEVSEKLISVAYYPERVTSTEQVEDSISSIYGTWSRNALSLLLFFYGPRLERWLTKKFS